MTNTGSSASPAASGTSSRAVKRAFVVTLAVLGLLLVSSIAVFASQRAEILPNTLVAGVDVGGLTSEQALVALEPIAAARLQDPTVFTFEETETELLPSEVGYTVDLDASVERAMQRGREGLPGDLLERARAFRRPATLGLVEGADPAALEAWVTTLADRLDRDEVRGDLLIDPDGPTVGIDPSRGSVAVDRTALGQLALAHLSEPGTERVPVPATTSEPPIDQRDLEELAEQVENAIAATLTLRSETGELQVEPRDLARLISTTETVGGRSGTTLEFAVTEASVDEVLGERASARFDIAPRDAGYEASRTPPATFDAQGNATYRPVAASVTTTPARGGIRFDAATAAEQLTLLLRDGTREAAVRLVEVPPELDAERAEALRPTHAIGTFTTYFPAGAVRNDNIRRLADTIDGAVVLPGQQFSINRISGERTCAKGYKPAGTIVRGELVDTCGGGVSQFGTTTFNAAFFAGVTLDQWKAHSWYISRYPMGREATLSYPELDVRFTNNTPGAILVKTAHTGTSVTVTLYGQPLADAVTATHSGQFAPRPYATSTRTSSSLPQGRELVVQSGTPGFTVRVTRDIALRGGGTQQQTITTVYVPQTRIVERGTRPPAPAAPAPDPEPTPAGT